MIKFKAVSWGGDLDREFELIPKETRRTASWSSITVQVQTVQVQTVQVQTVQVQTVQ